VVESLEDIWKVSRMQRERKQKEERERLARLQVRCRYMPRGRMPAGLPMASRPAACDVRQASPCDFLLLPPT
jgi:hypothetical protein